MLWLNDWLLFNIKCEQYISVTTMAGTSVSYNHGGNKCQLQQWREQVSVITMAGTSSVTTMAETSSVTTMAGTSSVTTMAGTSSVTTMVGTSSVTTLAETSSATTILKLLYSILDFHFLSTWLAAPSTLGPKFPDSRIPTILSTPGADPHHSVYPRGGSPPFYLPIPIMTYIIHLQ